MMKATLHALWLSGVTLLLLGCSFNGNVFRPYLPAEVGDALAIYNERRIPDCALSIYEVPDTALDMRVPLSIPMSATTDWMQLPIDGNIETSFALQALWHGENCFGRDAQQRTGLQQLSDYYSAIRNGYYIELKSDLILVHDITRNLIIISSRAR